MLGGDPLRASEVGDRAGHLQQPMTAPRAEVKPAAGGVKDPAAGGVKDPAAGGVEGAVLGERPSLEMKRESERSECVRYLNTNRYLGAPAG